MSNLDGLSSLTTVGGDLWISGNYALTNINGLSSVTNVPGDLIIWYNDVLCQTLVDAYVATVTVGGNTTDSPNDPGC
mgnify:CR=1 FL=1